MNVVRLKWINTDRLPHRVDGIPTKVRHGVVHEGHGDGRDQSRGFSWSGVDVMKTLEFSVRYGVWSHTREKFSRSAQFRHAIFDIVGAV